MRTPYKGGPSAWDTIQTCSKLAEGLYELTTAGHGGFWVSPDRCAELKRLFPGYEPWAGYPWLEEDCDWCLAPLAWPELFEAADVVAATKTAQRGSQGAAFEKFFKSDAGDRIEGIIRNYTDPQVAAN